MKWIIVTVTFFLLLLLIIPLVVYYSHFGNNHLSGSFKDWSEFSVFYSLFVSLFTGVILALLTWKIHQENMDLNKPLLVFTIHGKDHYPHTIKNIGNGPAINIDIYHSTNDVGWDRKIKGLTLAKGQEVPIKISGQKRLGTIYYDQSGRLYKSYMKDNSMRIENINSEFLLKPKTEIYSWQLD